MRVKASSFADPGDVARFHKCKLAGGTDEECFKVGDNGIGMWGDDTSEGSGNSCALPPDDMIDKWGSIDAAHLKPVVVSNDTLTIVAIVKDRLPWRKHIPQGRALIDLNPDSVRALGGTPGNNFEMLVNWEWKDEV